MRYLLPFLLLFALTQGFAQTPFEYGKQDNIWLFGNGFAAASEDSVLIWGGTRLEFTEDGPIAIYQEHAIQFRITNASICTPEGDLLFYTNGVAVGDSSHQVMADGTGLNEHWWTEQWEDLGLPIIQEALVLQHPGAANLFYIVHGLITPTPDQDTTAPYKMYKLYYSLVDMDKNGGLGRVIEKNVEIIDDELDYGRVIAQRHANGRDWWILLPKFETNEYYRFLIDADGVHIEENQIIGYPVINGGGQTMFSMAGKKFVRVSAKYVNQGIHFDIYDFDRCTGLLSNHIQFNVPDTMIVLGGALSPNGQFLYVSAWHDVFQFDLEAADIPGSQVLIGHIDGFESPPGLRTQFFLSQLAPDGRIYISSNTTNYSLGVIHRPDLPYPDCDFRQHDIQLPVLYDSALPNYPNFRSGPLDGSPCDTLGLDLLPEARFRFEVDTNNTLEVAFTDLSFGLPDSWYWDFGDGLGNSIDPHPNYEYENGGIYEVCLTIENQSGSDTRCREVEVYDYVSTSTIPVQKASVYPNPASTEVHLKLPQT
ncbi:MAG: PKD domain-containing protein, partial [Saprospiraceae bacterium]|nr:PKD domain-containing protein [Saprospiraceae bacterium]